MTAKQIIRHYLTHFNGQNDTWLSDCRNAKDFMAAVEMAGMSRNIDNDKHPHQFRLPNHILRKFTDRLLRKAESMLRCQNFEELHELVSSCRVKGIGILTIYDTAQRIGANLRIEPRRVYLHQGTRVGAERFFKRTLPVDSVDKKRFQRILRVELRSNRGHYVHLQGPFSVDQNVNEKSDCG